VLPSTEEIMVGSMVSGSSAMQAVTTKGASSAGAGSLLVVVVAGAGAVLVVSAGAGAEAGAEEPHAASAKTMHSANRRAKIFLLCFIFLYPLFPFVVSLRGCSSRNSAKRVNTVI
jgi:hypothetical protein